MASIKKKEHILANEAIRNFNLNQPKRTKEQKIIYKALTFIDHARHMDGNKQQRENDLCYAIGLLEALVMQDDEKEEK